jgi:hypothetical protein
MLALHPAMREQLTHHLSLAEEQLSDGRDYFFETEGQSIAPIAGTKMDYAE